MRIEDRGSRIEYSRCLPSPLTFAPRSSLVAPRGGLTLIELLITITILATLAAMFLGASNAAMESARSARTKTTISKIHSLLMERLDSYTTRRVDVRSNIEDDINAKFSAADRGKAMADARLLATRELMKLEMPDRWSDVLGDSVDNLPRTTPIDSFPVPLVLASRPSISLTYLRRYKSLNSSASNEEVIRNQGAECLYMMVMLFTGDGEARTQFSRQDIGDTDNDGALEFLDGWGRPIHFIRWPAGFFPRSDLMSGDADTDHDTFDPFRRDHSSIQGPPANNYPFDANWILQLRNADSAFRLVPLVYSAGSDGITDINNSGGLVTLFDPYGRDSNPPFEFEFGVPRDDANDGEDNSIDNIHNHLQDNR